MAENEKDKGKLKIAFTGDLSFSGYFRGREMEDVLAPEVKLFLKANQWTVINLESPVTEVSRTQKERLAHKSCRATVDFITGNFNNPIVSLANNHIMDFGEEGLADTLDAVESAGIPYVGAGRNLDEAIRPVVIKDEGMTAGLISIQYKKNLAAGKKRAGTFHESSSSLIKKSIRRLKSELDWVIVVYHGGEEFLHTPMPYNRKQLRRYIEWGADAVVAHHPHTVQGYEVYKGKYIFYSLGNFIFDTDYQRIQKDSEKGMLLSLEFDGNRKEIKFSNCPIRINREMHRVEAGERDMYFRNINHIDYERLWTEEALRKKSILAASNLVEPAPDMKLNKIEKIKIKLVESVKDPREAKRKLIKKLYIKKAEK